ncbi:WbqC family protein [Pseudomonas sp. OTU5201]|uniref:WbqC family protein n=1 Tax=Pseudomonas sp. OTU5201 TaxID=3043850 RepID=UPI00313B5F38
MSKTISIMQPYAFPYIGYFCLIEGSDVFVFYDDVNYKKRGWINRNKILINGRPHNFTIPLSKGSQNKLICNTQMHSFEDFKHKFLKQIQRTYRKSPFYEVGYKYVYDVLSAKNETISDVAITSIEKLYEMIGENKKFVRSSACFANTRGMARPDRLIEITKLLDSNSYINSIGGTQLYSKDHFANKGVNLSFVRPRLKIYKQAGTREFIAGLSIIDVVMNNDIENIKLHLQSYELV